MTSSSLELPSVAPKPTDEGVLPLSDLHKQGPIRAELLGLERLESQARRLAAECVLGPHKPASSPLLDRFVETRRGLVRAREEILARDRDEIHGIDADWLADNFHIIDEVLREVKQDLPRGYDLVLPKLGTTQLAGFPRVYALALTLIAHTDSELDETRINRFAQAFQEVSPLRIGELWALPTMFRLVLLDNLHRLAEEMLWGWDQRQRAERWYQQAIADGKASGLDQAASFSSVDVAPLQNPSGPFVMRLVQLLRDQEPSAATAARKLEAALAECGQDYDQLLRQEHHRQAANQLTVGNCVISLRLLSAVDWNAFFERNSLVEKILRDDPAGAYPLHDFATSDRYRKVVEKIARGSDADELEVTRKAIELARSAPENETAKRHVGYYLIDRGNAALRTAFGYQPEEGERLLDQVLAHPRAVYFGSIALLLAILLGVLCAAAGGGAGGWIWLALAVLVALLPASELAVGLVNHALTLLLRPRVLPKLEFKEGIPEEFATFVVMPSMLVRPRSAETLCERLETHYLANPNARVRFALLTDFTDADTEEKPEDHVLVREALERVEALNQRYAAGGPPLFFLFHRHRVWNPAQNCWMGWERKRGKLSEFNRLLRGDRTTTYSTCSSDPAALPRTRFVITLDADTQMPRDTVGRLIGTLAHPLNQPRFDPERKRVVEGFGVLQPRVSFHLTAATHSRFAGLLAASGGIDPYSGAASDAYMDLFGLGSFTGKGIYEVDAFEAATGETFPENHILSHDLIEGNYARCGLLSDTELFDDFPARYHAYARREHRWVRGDWQLLPWLGRRVPTPRGRTRESAARRGALEAPGQSPPQPRAPRDSCDAGLGLDDSARFALALDAHRRERAGAAAFQVVPGHLLRMHPERFPGRAAGVARQRDRPGGPDPDGDFLPRRPGAADVRRDRADSDATLGHPAKTTGVGNGGRHRAAAGNERARLREGDVDSTCAGHGHGPGHGVTAARCAVGRRSLTSRLVLLADRGVLGQSSPANNRDLSQCRGSARAAEDCAADLAFLRDLCWRRGPLAAAGQLSRNPRGPRGASYLADESGALARINPGGPRSRLSELGPALRPAARTFDTFDKLQRHWGQFYNWYDTRTLEPLPPAYISTVDSGNLLGCLVTLKQGLREKMREPLRGPAIMAGLEDTFRQIDESSRKSAGRLAQALWEKPSGPLEWDAALERLEHEAALLLDRVGAASRGVDSADFASRGWAEALLSQVRERRRELSSLAPWLPLVQKQHEPKGAASVPRDPDSESIWDKVVKMLSSAGSLEDLCASAGGAGRNLDRAGKISRQGPASCFGRSSEQVRRGRLTERLVSLASRAEALGTAMDFRPLYKPDRHLYAIGANLTQGQLDAACYDLLASESCLTSYLNVARGVAPRRHWFQLGRPYIRAAGRTGLISWGGTMFEYLMPRLVLRSLPGTLLAEAAATAVARQIEYGRQLGIPWGVSESAYNAQYIEGDYRYQAFGVPGLGLKRGLEKDRVVAPYATAMAAMISPREALANLRRLASEGAEGPFGFYEAVDYTPRAAFPGAASGCRQVVHGPPSGDEPGGLDQCRGR